MSNKREEYQDYKWKELYAFDGENFMKQVKRLLEYSKKGITHKFFVGRIEDKKKK